MKVEAIEKREDVSPKEGEKKYGSDANFADAKNKKYPLDTEAHVRAALSYWGMPKNRAKYSAEDQKTIGGRIRAAAKKHGIETSDDDDDDKKDKAESSLVYAAVPIDLEGQTPAEIVYMPKAEQITIRPRVSGKAKVVSLKVDASVADVLQADLEKRLSEPIPPYGGFNHDQGEASFLPKAFKWDEERGVMLELDWTTPGEQGVKGRGYSYFSPTFLLSNNNKVVGLPETGEIGSLTNDPAFRVTTMKISAANADDDDEKGAIECPKCGHKFKSRKTESMDVTQKLVELEVITAKQAESADEDFILEVVTRMYEELHGVQAVNASLVSQNTALQAKVADVQKAEATVIIEAAIAEGKIPAKDQNAIDFWTGQLVASPATAKKVLASMPANPLLQRVIDVKVKDGKRTPPGSEADLVQAQHLAVSEVQAANPNLSYTDAFNKAKREHPEVFPIEA